MNSVLIYPKIDIVNNYVDYKSVSILVIQKKGMLILYKRGASFKPDIIMVAYKLLILNLNILVYKLKQLLLVICKYDAGTLYIKYMAT